MVAANRQRKVTNLTFQDMVDGDLKNKKYRPIYYLVGEDSFRIESVVSHIRNDLLGIQGSAFNYHAFQGEQAILGDVLAQAMSYPMLGGRQVIWCRDAETCLADKTAELSLLKYLDDPVEQSCLIFSAVKLDGRRKWVKKAREYGFIFDFTPPKGDKLTTWIRKFARKSGLELDSLLAQALVERVGEDLHALTTEIEKLALLTEESGEPITREILESVIVEQSATAEFELVDSMQKGNPGPALQVWRQKVTWGSRAEEIAPMLLWRMRKIATIHALLKEGIPDKELNSLASVHPWVCLKLRDAGEKLGAEGIQRAMAASQRCDRALKRHATKSDVSLERAIIEICGEDSESEGRE